MSESDRVVISDTSPFQYLFQVGLLHLLPALHRQVVVPEAVVEEIAEGHRRGIRLPDLDAYEWISVQAAPEPDLLALETDLRPGERAVLALGAQAPNSLLLLDDALARQCARQ